MMNGSAAMSRPDRQEALTPSYAIVCTGLGNVFRGYESSSHELYLHLKQFGNCTLYAGGRKIDHGGAVLWNIPRGARVYDFVPERIASFYRRYRIECWTAGISLLKALIRHPVDAVFTPDHLLAEFLLRARNRMAHRPKIIFSNGAPFPSTYCMRYDFVHQKSFVDYEEGVARFGNKMKSCLIPNGFDRLRLERPTGFDGQAARNRLGLPADKRIVLSLAALQKTHKRLDWLIKEFAGLPSARFHLVLAGAETEETNSLRVLAADCLAGGNFTFTSVAPKLVPELIWASDVAVLCSLSEGFSNAIAEAMGARRFVLVHPHPNNRWILESPNCYVDMEKKGALRDGLLSFFARQDEFEPDIARNYRRFLENFTWDVLTPKYLEMFRSAA
jgi:glycosyltransferase involved in cell wall biosynthesis